MAKKKPKPGKAVSFLRQFHESGSTKGEFKAAEVYWALTLNEARELVELAINSLDDDSNLDSKIFSSMASFQPTRLRYFHERLLDKGILYPGQVYWGATDQVASRIVASIAASNNIGHMLNALAWIGNKIVQKAFHNWRESPPRWAKQLNVPPHLYAFEGGWELTPKGSRRDLFHTVCYPLVKKTRHSSDIDPISIGRKQKEVCKWCQRALTTLFDLDLSHSTLHFLDYRDSRLKITTCDVCTCYSDLFAKIGGDGSSAWHPCNAKPSYLPDNSDDWPRLPTNPLMLAEKPRSWHESIDWLVQGVQFSQVGGFPTWVQHAGYPSCPQCKMSMPFVAQLDNSDITKYGEGIYYAFWCRKCGVAATSYQQS